MDYKINKLCVDQLVCSCWGQRQLVRLQVLSEGSLAGDDNFFVEEANQGHLHSQHASVRLLASDQSLLCQLLH